MRTTNLKSASEPAKTGALATFFSMLMKKATDIFEPEEVEVTFEQDHGKMVRYTYTKVANKHVA